MQKLIKELNSVLAGLSVWFEQGEKEVLSFSPENCNDQVDRLSQ